MCSRSREPNWCLPKNFAGILHYPHFPKKNRKIFLILIFLIRLESRIHPFSFSVTVGLCLLLNREREDSVFASQFLINRLESVQFMFNVGLIFAIQVNFVVSRAVEPVSEALSNNIGRIGEILQDGVVNSSESPAPRSLLEFDVVVSAGLGQDGSLGDDDDVFAAEFLLELADEASLNLMICREERIWDKNHDGLLIAGDGDLPGPAEVEGAEFGPQIGRRVLDFGQGTDHFFFGRRRNLASRFNEFPSTKVSFGRHDDISGFKFLGIFFLVFWNERI